MQVEVQMQVLVKAQVQVQPLQHLAMQAAQAEAVIGPAQALMAQPVKAWPLAWVIQVVQAMHHQTSRPARALA